MDMPTFTRTQGQVDLARPLEPGSSLGPYLILNQVSSSRYATVYLAHDVMLDRAVILKTTPTVNPDGAALMRNEARALSRVRTSYVVALYALYDERPAPVLVLEHLVGETLAQRLESRGPLPAATATALFIGLLSGLERMHHAGVTHGNIKPENLFLTTDGQPKLVGLQLATLHDRPMTGPARSPDPLYCPPERLSTPATAPRDDLFSLGLCLYEAVTGTLPFEKQGRPHSSWRSPPQSLMAVLNRAISKDPDMRFSSAAAFRDALSATALTPGSQRTPVAWRSFVRGLVVDTALIAMLAGLAFALGLHPFAETPGQATANEAAAPVRPAASSESRPVRPAGEQDRYDALRQAWGG